MINRDIPVPPNISPRPDEIAPSRRSRLLPAAYGIPWVPEIPRQCRQGTEPGVTAVTNVFGIPDDPAAGTQPRAARPPTPGTPDDPAAGTQPRAARPPTPG